MKLLTKEISKRIEELLCSYYIATDIELLNSIDELNSFFKGTNHYKFLKIYYYERHKYKNRYPRKQDLFKKIYMDLYIEEPTLYQIKKEVMYKAAMIFYRNGIIR